MWTVHPTSWFCQETVEGEEGAGVHVGGQVDSASACVQAVGHFEDRLFHPAANEHSLGGPLFSAFQNCFVTDSDRYSEIAKHWLLERKCFMQIKGG